MVRSRIALATASVIAAVLLLTNTALAATIEVDKDAGKYDIYCLLTGTPDSSSSLSFVTTSFPATAWQKATGQNFASPSDAAAWLGDVGSEKTLDLESAALDSGTEFATVKGGKSVIVPAGYYLVVNKNTNPEVIVLAEDDSKAIHASARAVPKIDAYITGEGYSKSPASKTSSATIGKPVHFTIDGSLPDDYDLYDQFYYAFSVNGGEALRFDDESVSVTLYRDGVGKPLKNGFDVESEDDVVKVSFDDLKQFIGSYEEGAVIELDIAASLTDKSSSGTDSPNSAAAKVLFGSESDNVNETESVSFKITSFKVKADLVDESGNTLSGGFYVADEDMCFLTESGSWSSDVKDAFEYATDSDGTATIHGLGPGTYYLCQSSAQDGYAGYDEAIGIEISTKADADGTDGLSCRVIGDQEEVSFKGAVASSGSIKIQVVNGKYDGIGSWSPTYLTSNDSADNDESSWLSENWWVFLAGIAALILLVVIGYRIMGAERRSNDDEDVAHPQYVSVDDEGETEEEEKEEEKSCEEADSEEEIVDVTVEDLTGKSDSSDGQQ